MYLPGSQVDLSRGTSYVTFGIDEKGLERPTEFSVLEELCLSVKSFLL